MYSISQTGEQIRRISAFQKDGGERGARHLRDIFERSATCYYEVRTHWHFKRIHCWAEQFRNANRTPPSRSWSELHPRYVRI